MDKIPFNIKEFSRFVNAKYFAKGLYRRE